MQLLSKEDLEQLDRDIIKQLKDQNRIEDIKSICRASGKNDTSILNIEGLKVLEEVLPDYQLFYNSL